MTPHRTVRRAVRTSLENRPGRGDVLMTTRDSGQKHRALRLEGRLGLRPAEVAEALGLSERTVRQILRELPHVRFGTAVVVPVDSLREWLRDRARAELSEIDAAVENALAGLE